MVLIVTCQAKTDWLVSTRLSLLYRELSEKEVDILKYTFSGQVFVQRKDVVCANFAADPA